jgi:hypothetical protein
MTLQEILADPKTFADGIEMTIGNEKVNLGQLRELSANQQRQLSEKIAGAESRESIARDTATKAANLLAELQTARDNLQAQKTTPPTDDDFDKEEFWSPVRKRFSDRDTKIDQAIKGIETLSNQVKNAAAIWFKDRTRSQYEKVSGRLKKVDAYKDWDADKVLGYATEHRIVDEDGMPSVEKAILELTKANDIETIKKEAYAEGMKAAKQKGRLDAQPRPSSATGGRQPVDKSAVAEIGLEGLGDDAMNDPELMEMFSEIQNGGGGVQ